VSARRSCQAGVTLVELMVAIGIFALIATAAYAGLSSVLEARAHADERAERLAAVQGTVDALADDLRQALPRPVRSQLRGRGHALTGGTDPRDVLLLTRGGWSNPAGLPRSTLARVNWRLEDGRLLRTWRARPDAVGGTGETRRLRLTDVDEVELRFLGDDGEWRERWPGLARTETSAELPRAVEVTLVLADWGQITRLFDLAPGARGAVAAEAADDG